MTYDTAIIGAGINGCATAYFLTQGGEKVALIDREGIAAGGSGAAGAFVSPKFSKGGPLKALMEESYLFSLDFYERHFPDLIRVASLIHFAKYEDENEKVRAFRETTALPMLSAMPEAPLMRETEAFERVVLARSGLVNAQAVCTRLAEGSDFILDDINIIKYESGFWTVGAIRAKRVILATGAYRPVVAMPHITLRAVWGHRVDIKTTTPLPCHLHQYVSIAATGENGEGAIGATHDVHYDPLTATEPYDVAQGRAELLEKAARTVRLEHVEVVKDYTGLRSGSNDYYPLVGRVADAEASLRAFPGLTKGVKSDAASLVYHPGLYMINGTGGYGFVMGPLLARTLAESLLEGKPLPEALDPTRFLYRWAKRAGK
ncbi:FAD-dependent oxidoreductase [Sulfurimonas sp. HSL-3221]|uniref:FAD-dependent oxidoreductase n=1 Tax=Sulfurimonadaceae TaxID=2771471 RepID=UPI001E4E12D5|nr:FAD-dependent oxidoreductase [Sulfurimonas sp. HSL-3221]UFS61373.1 FAD-dependent oxidoreductase [Sulfurimonas sp. HSL-3221]